MKEKWIKMDKILVSILDEENDSNELYEEWNKVKNTDIRDVKCACEDCSSSDVSFYIVEKIGTSDGGNRHIAPICLECYKLNSNYPMDKNLLVKIEPVVNRKG